MARAHELSTSVSGVGYPIRPVDRWYLRTRADLELDGNSFGGNFLDTTMETDGPRRILQRAHFTTACNNGMKPGTLDAIGRGADGRAEAKAIPTEKRTVRLPPPEEMQRQTMHGNSRGFRSAGDLQNLPQLPQLPAGRTMEGFNLEPMGRGKKKKLKSVSADTRYDKRGMGRGGPMFWPENSFSMSQTMANFNSLW